MENIVRKEILEYINSPRFVFTFLLCTILILLSFYTGINSYRAELHEYNAAVALNRNNLENQANYQTLAGIGIKVNKPPQVLSTIVTGVQDAVGRQSTVNIATDPNLIESKNEANPMFAIFGELDLALIVKIVLSLFAILFTYDSIAGERERGTLKLSLSNSIPRDKLILGKAIGGFVSLLAPFIIPFIMGLIILMVYPDISLAGEDWMRIGLIFVLFLLYLSVFFSLGMFVSTRTGNSSTSLFILLFIWIMFIFVIPKGAVIAAGEFNPIPSVHEVTAQKDAFLQEIMGSVTGVAQEWMRENPPDGTPEWQTKFRKFNEDFQQSITDKIDANNAALEKEQQAKQQRQRTIAMNISRISPASAMTYGAMRLGRTGTEEHERFLNSIKTYKPVFTKWVNAKLMLSDNSGNLPKPEIGDLPMHEFKPENLRVSFFKALPDFVIMIFMIFVFLTGAFVSFLRYDVR